MCDSSKKLCRPRSIDDLGNWNAKQILGHWRAEGSGQRPAGQRGRKHQHVEQRVSRLRGDPLPSLQVARQNGHGMEPAPQEPQN